MLRYPCFLVLILALSGCMAKGTIPAKPIEPLLRRVVIRHDAYVESNEELSPGQKQQALLDSEILIKNLNAALEGVQ